MINFNIRHYYYPNYGSTFGILNDSKSTSLENHLELVEGLDLNWRPVQTFSSGVSLLVTRVLLILMGEFLQIQALGMANKEKGACEKIFKLFLYVQMIYWPTEVLFITTTDWIHPLDEILGSEFCDVFFFIKYFAWHIIVFHSFVIASIRYMFIIHNQFAEIKGKEGFKTFFFWSIILVSMVTTIWKYFGSGDLDSDPYLNKCRGKYHREFLLFRNAMEGVKRYCDKEYDPNIFSSYLTAMVQQISCIASSFVFILMGLNISEGFLYTRVILHIRRYVKLFILLINMVKKYL